jgi:hypothetical protein
MTKPFESIRQLWGRMLGGESAGGGASEYSTLGINLPEAQPSMNGNGHAEERSQPAIEVQTADTQRLPQVAPEFLNARNGDAKRSRVSEHDDEFGDALLDLGEVRGGKAFAGDDPLQDILDENAPHRDFVAEAIQGAPAHFEESPSISDAFAQDSLAPVAQVLEEEQDCSSAAEVFAVEAVQLEGERHEPADSIASPAEFSDLSPGAVDAIARRVVAQLSDKVVREIAWEVVPELSELLIKQKLEAR